MKKTTGLSCNGASARTPSSPPHRRRRQMRRRGITLIEAMISLAISTSLLTAVGAAFCSSSKAITVNDEFYRATQAARVTVNQIMTEVRRCTSINVFSDHIDMMTYASENRTYAFDPAGGIVTVHVRVVTLAPT